MNVLGIDYGDRHVGVAIGSTDTGLSQPLTTIDVSLEDSSSGLLQKLQELITQHEIKRIVIGVSEGRSGESAQQFSHLLERAARLPVSLADETFSSQESTVAMKMASKKKRRRLHHAAAAAIILERWLDDAHETDIDYSSPDTV